MHEQSQVIGLYFSGGHKDSDEAPRFVNRISKGILARADICVIVQLKSAQIQDPSKLAIGVSLTIARLCCDYFLTSSDDSRCDYR